MKELASGDFGAAWGGISSLQLGLPVVWTQARRRGFSLGDVALLDGASGRPGSRAWPRKGRIAPGYDADFCVFAPEETFTVDPARLHHRHPGDALCGPPLHGVVRGTILRGEPVDDGAPAGTAADPGRGLGMSRPAVRGPHRRRRRRTVLTGRRPGRMAGCGSSSST